MILRAYAAGFTHTADALRAVLFVHAISLLVSMGIAYPVKTLVEAAAGSSADIKQLVQGFDYTLFSTLWSSIHHLGDFFGGGIFAAAVVYFVVSVFITGGILKTMNKTAFSMRQFFEGGTSLFFRYALLSLTMLTVQLLIAFCIYSLAFNIADTALDNYAIETDIVIIFVLAVVLHAIIVMHLLVVSDYARCYILLNANKNVFKAIIKSYSFVVRNFFSTHGLFLLLMVVPAISLYIYLSVDDDIGMTSTTTIVVMLLIQQTFIFIRSWCRVWTFGAQLEFFTAHFVKDDKLNSERARLQQWEEQVQQLQREKLQNAQHTLPSQLQTPTNTVKTTDEKRSNISTDDF